jgi:sugar/nucleoside kinase (ribokinase family)
MARQHHIKVALSLSDPNMVTYFRQGLLDIIDGQVDILFCNEDEAKLFTESDGLEEATERLKSYAKTFAITLGSRGALIYNGADLSHVLPYKTNVVDTVGAGDVFSGVFLYGITHGLDYIHAADLANFAAAKVVAKFGPRLSQEEIDEVSVMVKEQRKYA